MEITVYVVWTRGNPGNIDISISKEEALKTYERYGEYANWSQKTFHLNPNLEKENEI
jgi:hypothetical protein